MEQFIGKGAGRQPRSDTVADRPWSQTIATLRASISGADMPHLLFYGPPGTGKTSTILAVARELFGAQLLKERVLELNASDERGISVVRDKIKTFASTTVSKRVEGYPCPHEADAMTSPAQSALRRTMEKYSNVTRFCLICNYISRIIEPLASRCAKFRFKPLSNETMLSRLQFIRDKEGVTCSDQVLERIVELSGGDMRRGISLLHSAYRVCGQDALQAQHVEDISGNVHPSTVAHLLLTCRSEGFEKMQEHLQSILLDGFAADTILEQILQQVIESDDITDLQKAAIAHKLAKADKRLIDGSDEELQLLDLCGTIMQELQR
eukprot:gene9747-1950_t